MKMFKLIAIFPLLALSLAGCAATIGTSPKGLEIPIEKAAVRFSADLQVGGYRIVTTEELKKWFDEGRPVTMVSTLPPAIEREFGIIPGAFEAVMPNNENELTPEDLEHILRAAGADKKRTLIIYSGFMACRRSHIAAKMLVDYGFKNVYRYPAGLAGWREAGYPLVW